jgi:hypothetical protein
MGRLAVQAKENDKAFIGTCMYCTWPHDACHLWEENSSHVVAAKVRYSEVILNVPFNRAV